MKTPYETCPAAHSMDTDWFALDEKGNVGAFFTGETGALPHRALSDADQSGELATDVAAALIQLRAKEVRWRKRGVEDAYEVVLIAAKKPVFGAHVKSGVLRLVSKAPLALYAPLDELDDDELLEELLEHEECVGCLMRDDLAAAAGIASYEGGSLEAAGEYARFTAPRGNTPLPPALKKKLARFTLPVDFSKARVIQLWKHVPESKVSMWESGVPYDGGVAASKEKAASPRRFEFVAGGSSKFWEVHVEGTTLHVRFGRIGTDGQLQQKKLRDADTAVAEVEKLIREKTNKGYRPVGQLQEEEKKEAAGWQPLDRQAFKALTLLDPGKRRAWQRDEQVGEVTITWAFLELGTVPAFGDEGPLKKLGLERDSDAAPSFAPDAGTPVPLPDGSESTHGHAVTGFHGERVGKRFTLRFGVVSQSNVTSQQWLAVGIASGPFAEDFKAFEHLAQRRAASVAIDAAIKRDDAKAALAALPRDGGDLDGYLSEAVGKKAWKVFEALLTRLPKADQQVTRDELIETLGWREAIKHGASIDTRGYGGTPLSQAEDLRELKALIAAGAKLDAPTGEGTAIHALESAELVLALVKAGASLVVKDRKGRTALQSWLERLTFATPAEEDLAVAKEMLKRGASPSGEALKKYLAPWLKKAHLTAAARELLEG